MACKPLSCPTANPDSTTTKPDVLRLALSANEACIALGIGRRLLWSLSNAGEIPSAKIGGRRVYPVAALEKYLSEQAEKGRGQ